MRYDDEVKLFYCSPRMKARSLKCQATMALFELIKPYMIDVDELDEKRHGKQSRDLDLFDVAVYNKL